LLTASGAKRSAFGHSLATASAEHASHSLRGGLQLDLNPIAGSQRVLSAIQGFSFVSFVVHASGHRTINRTIKPHHQVAPVGLF
jgi:hypothetical protein